MSRAASTTSTSTAIMAADPHLLGMAHVARQVAERADIAIELVGVRALTSDIEVYAGPKTDWVLAPMRIDPSAAAEITIPRYQLDRLWCLYDSGLRFPAIYVAHEIRQSAAIERSQLPRVTKGKEVALRPGYAVDAATASRLVPAPPPARRTAAMSRRLGAASRTMLKTLAGATLAAGALAAAPLPLLAAVGSGLGEGLDPMIFGVMTADGSIDADTPAAWCLLAQWDWS